MTHPTTIAELKYELFGKSSDELEIIKAEGDGSPSPAAFNRRIAAAQILNDCDCLKANKHKACKAGLVVTRYNRPLEARQG